MVVAGTSTQRRMLASVHQDKDVKHTGRALEDGARYQPKPVPLLVSLSWQAFKVLRHAEQISTGSIRTHPGQQIVRRTLDSMSNPS